MYGMPYKYLFTYQFQDGRNGGHVVAIVCLLLA
jgi:hypothetical protein